jgi:cytochrome bd ubiquinol oxidase subunit II
LQVILFWALCLLRSGRPLTAFIASAIGVAGVVATAGLSLPSFSPRRRSAERLIVCDASSSPTTPFIMSRRRSFFPS